MDKPEEIKLYLSRFRALGIKTTVIKNKSTKHNFEEKNILKSPYHEWDAIESEDKTQEDYSKLDINGATGVGCVLGYKNLRAIDIDGCLNFKVIEEMLEILGLPKSYPWVVRSGSQIGYHIIFKCSPKNGHLLDTKNEERFNTYTNNGKIIAYKANRDYRHIFDKLELRFNGHLVLPPSLHISSHEYEFINGSIPKERPLTVEVDSIAILVDRYVVSGIQSHLLSYVYGDDFELGEFESKSDSNRSDLALILDFNTKHDEQSDEFQLIDIAWKVFDGDYIHESKSYTNKNVKSGDSFLRYDNVFTVGEDLHVILSELCRAIDKCSFLFVFDFREKIEQLINMVSQIGVRQSLNFKEYFDLRWIEAYHDCESQKKIFDIYNHFHNSMYLYSDITVPRNSVTNVSLMLKCAYQIIHSEEFEKKKYKVKLQNG